MAGNEYYASKGSLKLKGVAESGIKKTRQDDPGRRLVWVTGAARQGDRPSWAVLCWLEGAWASKLRGQSLCSPLRGKLSVPQGLPLNQVVPWGTRYPALGGSTRPFLLIWKKKKNKNKESEKEMAASIQRNESPNSTPVKEAPNVAVIRNYTEAERRFMERQRKMEADRILKKASKTHKEKVEDFNRHLDSLTEHFDIPKVSWTK